MAPVRTSEGRLRLGLAVVCLALGGAGAGYALRAPTPAAAGHAEVTVGGQRVDLSARPETEAARLAQTHLRGTITLVTPLGPRTRSRQDLGVSVDEARLRALLAAAQDPRSVMRRAHAQTGRAVLDLPMPAALDPDPATALLLDLKDRVDTEAVPARMDTVAKQPVAGHPGERVDVWATLDDLAEAAHTARTKVEAVVEHSREARTLRDMADARMEAVLGTFETRYNASDKAQDRTHNLKVAAAKLDGLVLLPGEILDFNEIVGERTETNGFRPAPVISSGELVDGVGGGACQVAGTLHAAAFFAGLAILERHPHSRPSSYIKLGLDAAVSYPKLNLRLKNDLDVPVTVEMRIEGGVAKATLWGTPQDRLVTFQRRVDEATPFEERVTEDPELPAGVRVVTQKGIPGFKVTRFRIVRDLEKNQAVRTRSEDTYPPTTRIVRVGTGPEPPDDYEPPPGDTHPEYVADEHMTLTQGAGIAGTAETRRQGFSGYYGWMEAAKLTPETRDGDPPAGG